MLPLNHLPRNGGEHLSSESAVASPPDPVLELLSPLFADGSSSEAGPSTWNASSIRGVREKLESAIVQNKKRRHELLLSQFANVSSHIQRGQQLQGDHTRISESLKRLSAQLVTGDPSTSFLPPTVNALERHFSALRRRDAARARVKALKLLQQRAQEVEKLEEAVWTGRGADDWVIEQLKLPSDRYEVDEGWEVVGGTSAMRDIQARRTLLRGMVVEQATDAFGKAVSFAPPSDQGAGVTVQNGVKLPLPRIPRSGHPPDPTKSSAPPPYPLSHIYTTLHAFDALSPLLNSLQSRLLKEIVLPLVSNPPHFQLSSSNGDHSSSLNLTVTPPRAPADVLGDVSTLLNFIASSIFPTTSPNLSQPRTTFLGDLHRGTWRSVLEHLIVPALPATLSGVQAWLDLLARASEAETSSLPDGASKGAGVVAHFAESEAGIRWANGRRHRVAEEVRKLVLGGWGGWEGMEVEVEKEIMVVTEVEVDEPPEPISPAGKGEDAGDEGFGWDFDDTAAKPTETASTTTEAQAPNGTGSGADPAGEEEAEEGWGFDEPSSTATVPATSAKPSTPPPKESTDEGEGWDFDLPDPAPAASLMPPPPVPTLISPKRPVREAKKLGRALAKAKAAAEETTSEVSDDWGSDTGASSARRDSVFSDGGSSAAGGNGGAGSGVAGMLDSLLGDSVRGARSASQSSHSRQPSASASNPPPATEDGWGWDEPPSAPPPTSSLTRQRGVDPSINAIAAKQVAKKRLERREEKRRIKEKMMVSRACTKLLDIADRITRETADLREASFPHSWSPAAGIVRQSLGDAFDLYRALIATHYAIQLREVPVLAMQVANDHSHLGTALEHLAADGDGGVLGLEDTISRLRSAGEGVYETFLEVQRESLLSTLEEGHVAHVGTDSGFKLAERGVKQVVHNLESLGRVLKPVITPSTYFPTLGYLLDCVLFYLTGEILSILDITEMESNRLNELLKMLHPLEELFKDSSTGQVRVVEFVKSWLRFCYISELLVANLVDITYLFDTGALIDFTADELVGLIRALFADSPKRDAAIDKISHGIPGQIAAGGQ